MLRKFSDEQLAHIVGIIDLPFWIKKFKTIPADVALVQEICKEAGIE